MLSVGWRRNGAGPNGKETEIPKKKKQQNWHIVFFCKVPRYLMPTPCVHPDIFIIHVTSKEASVGKYHRNGQKPGKRASLIFPSNSQQ